MIAAPDGRAVVNTLTPRHGSPPPAPATCLAGLIGGLITQGMTRVSTRPVAGAWLHARGGGVASDPGLISEDLPEAINGRQCWPRLYAARPGGNPAVELSR